MQSIVLLELFCHVCQADAVCQMAHETCAGIKLRMPAASDKKVFGPKYRA